MKTLPKELQKLIDSKQWPLNQKQFSDQKVIFTKEIVKELFPEEDELFFYLPPFKTVEQLIEGGEQRYWKSKSAKIEQIAPKETLIIGDFGMGADVCIALDYRFEEPKVIKLIYAKKWVTVAQSFKELSAKLELRKTIWA